VSSTLPESRELRATSNASRPRSSGNSWVTTGSASSEPSASASITSSISSLKRNDPTSSSSRVMASETGTGCGPEGSRPTITTRPPRTAPLIAEARP